MPVNFSNPFRFLVIHGVETGTDADQNQNLAIAALLQQYAVNLITPPTTEMYRYKDINNRNEQPAEILIDALLNAPIETAVANDVIQLVGDVVNSLADGSTAELIRQGLRDAIAADYAAGLPVVIVAHSLGSIYAWDVINDLLTEPTYFNPNDRTTWPVQALVTMGSPIGLSLFNSTRRHVNALRPGQYPFRWHNYFDPNDPIVSGNIFGLTRQPGKIAENYTEPGNGWAINDFQINTGELWLMAHTAYWNQPTIGVDLVWLAVH